MAEKIRMISIDLMQATGTLEECKRRATVQEWSAADTVLRGWDSDRPEKVDYVVHFEDGNDMEGTVEIGPAGDRYGFRSFTSDITWGMRELMSLDPEREPFRKFVDKNGEKRLAAIVNAARYDFGCDLDEPAIADASVLQAFMDGGTAGRDADITVAGSEDVPVIVFADGQVMVTDTPDTAKYLLRQWRIMNNIHPVLGGDTPLFENTATPGHAR